jgi:hypothetical protein
LQKRHTALAACVAIRLAARAAIAAPIDTNGTSGEFNQYAIKKRNR